MIEPTQILLFIVVVVLTTLTCVIGWQIYLILSEIKKMLSKFNLMADNAVNLTSHISNSLRNISGFSDGLRAVLKLFKVFKKKEDENE